MLMSEDVGFHQFGSILMVLMMGKVVFAGFICRSKFITALPYRERMG